MDPNELLDQYYGSGAMDTVLPFFVLFIIIYSLLAKAKFFSRAANAAIAGVVALVTVLMHVAGSYPPCADVVTILTMALPKLGIAAIVAIAFVFVLFLIGSSTKLGSTALGFTALVAALVVGYVFATSPGPGCEPLLKIEQPPWWIVGIAVLVALIWFFNRAPGKRGLDNLF